MVGMMLRWCDRSAGRHLRSWNGGLRWRLNRWMGRSPIGFEVIGDVFARVLQLVLIQDDIEHLWWALRQLFGRHHLDVEVAALRFTPWLDQPLQNLKRKKSFGNLTNSTKCLFKKIKTKRLSSILVVYFRRGDLQINDEWCQRGFGQLRWMIDRIAIQDDQLRGNKRNPIWKKNTRSKWDSWHLTDEYNIPEEFLPIQRSAQSRLEPRRCNWNVNWSVPSTLASKDCWAANVWPERCQHSPSLWWS